MTKIKSQKTGHVELDFTSIEHPRMRIFMFSTILRNFFVCPSRTSIIFIFLEKKASESFNFEISFKIFPYFMKNSDIFVFKKA